MNVKVRVLQRNTGRFEIVIFPDALNFPMLILDENELQEIVAEVKAQKKTFEKKA